MLKDDPFVLLWQFFNASSKHGLGWKS